MLHLGRVLLRVTRYDRDIDMGYRYRLWDIDIDTGCGLSIWDLFVYS